MKLKRPRRWRKGQVIFNYLEWLYGTGKAEPNQNQRMADPFYISDEDWDMWWDEHQKEVIKLNHALWHTVKKPRDKK